MQIEHIVSFLICKLCFLDPIVAYLCHKVVLVLPFSVTEYTILYSTSPRNYQP